MANSRIDPKEDLLCLPWVLGMTDIYDILFKKSIWSEEALIIERTAIDSRAWYKLRIGDVLKTFKHLKVVTIIAHASYCQHELDASGKIHSGLSKGRSTKTEPDLRNFMRMGHYQRVLDNWWNTDSVERPGEWVKPRLVGVCSWNVMGRVVACVIEYAVMAYWVCFHMVLSVWASADHRMDNVNVRNEVQDFVEYIHVLC